MKTKLNTKIRGVMGLRIMYFIVGVIMGISLNIRPGKVIYKVNGPARASYLVDSPYYYGRNTKQPQEKVWDYAEI